MATPSRLLPEMVVVLGFAGHWYLVDSAWFWEVQLFLH